jgi:hypothetical protein
MAKSQPQGRNNPKSDKPEPNRTTKTFFYRDEQDIQDKIKKVFQGKSKVFNPACTL